PAASPAVGDAAPLPSPYLEPCPGKTMGEGGAMTHVNSGMEADHGFSLGRRYLIEFEEDTLRQRPLWIRLIIEFVGTVVLVTVAAGSGVISDYAGGDPISRTAAVIAPGAAVMAMIYAWGPLSG